VPDVVSIWNDYLVHDSIDEKSFEEIVLGDPNVEETGNVVILDDGKIIGFLSLVSRCTAKGKDGKGTIQEFNQGYIKCIILPKDGRKEDCARIFLEYMTDFFLERGKEIILTGDYTGLYFFPGIDVRYEDLVETLFEIEFQGYDTENDVIIDLVNFQITVYQKSALNNLKRLGITIRDFKTADLPSFRHLANDCEYPSWFPEGWEKNFCTAPTCIVAVKGENKIIGWAQCTTNKPIALFGPILVMHEFRQQGIGSCLLLECMTRCMKIGVEKLIAGWANVPFYVKNGWKIHRTYIVLQKRLSNNTR